MNEELHKRKRWKMSDWEELQLAMQHLREAWAGLVLSVKEAFVSATHPVVERVDP